MNPKIRAWLDILLNHLAEGSSLSSRSIEHTLRLFRPHWAGIIELRRGNLTAAHELSAQRAVSPVHVRSGQMLQCLRAGFPVSGSRNRSLAFNGRILYAVHSYSKFDANGYGVRSAQTLGALKQQGLQVFPIARLGYPWDLLRHPDLPKTEIISYQGDTYTHRYDPAGGISRPEIDYVQAYAGYLQEAVRSNNCTVIHSNSNFLNGLAANMAAKATGCRSVYEMRGLWHLTRASVNPSYAESEHFAYCNAMEVQAAAEADAVIAISQPLAEWLQNQGIPRNKIHVIPNAALPQPGPIATRDAETMPSTIEIVYAGAITWYEGLETLLDAARLLHEKGAAVHLTLAGDGPHATQIRRYIERNALQPIATMTGRIAQARVNELYANATLCVLPRRKLPVTELVAPLKGYEIMSRKVPLIVSDLPPLREVVGDGAYGLLVPPDDASALAEKIVEVVNHPVATSERVEKAYKWVTQERNWKANGALYGQLYQADHQS